MRAAAIVVAALAAAVGAYLLARSGSDKPAEATVAVSVNGQVSHVARQGTFPTGTPVFRLVSWTKVTAQIAIVGGSYQTGDPTLALQLGQPVTLENQTDGKRYRIELLSTG